MFAAGGGAIAVALWRRFKGRWWIPASAAVVAVGAVFLYASPLVIEPLFNRFEELPEGKLRSEVLDLSERAGVDVGEVYRVDASRRTTGANAYVAGLGPHQARRSLRQPDRGLHTRRGPLGGRARARTREARRCPARPPVPRADRAARHAARAADGPAPGPGCARRGSGPGAGALGRGRQLCRADRGELRVARGRGARRRVRPAPDERARRVHLAGAAAGGAEHLGARSARAAPDAVRDAPDHARAHRLRRDVSADARRCRRRRCRTRGGS